MSSQYFQHKDLNPMVNSMERPLKELMDLNVKTVQGLLLLLLWSYSMRVNQKNSSKEIWR